MDQKRYDEGLAVRRAVLGAEYVDKSVKAPDEFSKPMQDGSWSWTGSDYMPETVGKPRYLSDGRTCVLTVKLEPGRTYLIGINSPSHRNFKDREGRPAMTYLLAFETKK